MFRTTKSADRKTGEISQSRPGNKNNSAIMAINCILLVPSVVGQILNLDEPNPQQHHNRETNVVIETEKQLPQTSLSQR